VNVTFTSMSKSHGFRKPNMSAVGSNATEMDRSNYVRFPPDSDQTAEVPDRQLRAGFTRDRTASGPMMDSAETRQRYSELSAMAFALFSVKSDGMSNLPVCRS
jgi:hypothetical protein